MTTLHTSIAGCAVLLCSAPLARAQTDWQQLPMRGAVEYPASAFDHVRDRLMVFGGRDATGRESDTTLEWDGSGWQTRTPAVAPPARYGAAAAFDAARGVVVLFGGARRGTSGELPFGDTWEWNGSTWTERLPATSPSPRLLAAMTYDSTRQRVLMFGGSPGTLEIAETWEWDGSTWTQRQPLHEPPGRAGAAMAHDPRRGRVVLFGGSCFQFGPCWRGDTWEWDGNDWTDRSPAFPQPAPGARWSHGMAFDAARQQVVLFGGSDEPSHYKDDTWEWDGVTWRERMITRGPVGRLGFACGFDAARQRLLVYGGTSWIGHAPDLWALGAAGWQRLDRGQQPWIDFVPTGDLAWDGNHGAVIWHGGNPEQPRQTWELREAAWDPVTEGQGPIGREALRLCWLPAQQRVIAYQPTTGVTPDETWTFDGANWTQLQPPGSPGVGGSPALALDPRGDRLLLFGLTGVNTAATFWFDGSTWTTATTAVAPAARESHAMVLDAARQRIVLFGGRAPLVATWFGDTWEWDGLAWQQHSPPLAPGARSGHALAFDGGRRRVVLLGGQDQTGTLADTWEWDGSTWTRRQPANPPAALWWQRLCYEPARDTVARLAAAPAGTWRYGPVQRGSFTLFGQGCGGSAGVPLLRAEGDQRPYTGSRFHLILEHLPDPVGFLLLGWSNTSWFGVVPLPASLGPLGHPQCALLVQTDDVVLLPLLQGAANWSLWIPNAPALIGTTLHGQGLAFDPAGPSGLAMTAGASFRVGGS